jgi:hypothetical protein
LALTFGTLLSSQGADAQRTRPSRAFVPGGLSHSTPCTARCHTRGCDLAAPGSCNPVSLGAKRKLRGPGTVVKPLRALARLPGPFPWETCCSGGRVHRLDGTQVTAGRAVEQAQSPRSDSIPTVRPGRAPISRTARSTPGMNDARS